MAPLPSNNLILSNETTYTNWTTAIVQQPIYSAPSKRSARISRLQLFTTDGYPQPYVVLEMRKARTRWVEIRVPGRPNGRVGWVPRGDLDSFGVVNTELVLARAARHITLYRSGREIFQAPVGVGKPSTPTPPGHFWITEKFSVHGQPVYGPYAMGTSDYSVLSDWPGGGIVGLHGTDQPQLVPGDPSHGCIRMHDSDILRLARLVPIGTPLLIQ